MGYISTLNIALLNMAVLGFLFCTSASAQTRYKKTQEVNFDGANVDGLVQKPTGSFVVQKRGVDFVPLYKVRQKFDSSILESIDYLR